jgi:hypothetical protein
VYAADKMVFPVPSQLPLGLGVPALNSTFLLSPSFNDTTARPAIAHSGGGEHPVPACTDCPDAHEPMG